MNVTAPVPTPPAAMVSKRSLEGVRVRDGRDVERAGGGGASSAHKKNNNNNNNNKGFKFESARARALLGFKGWVESRSLSSG